VGFSTPEVLNLALRVLSLVIRVINLVPGTQYPVLYRENPVGISHVKNPTHVRSPPTTTTTRFWALGLPAPTSLLSLALPPVRDFRSLYVLIRRTFICGTSFPGIKLNLLYLYLPRYRDPKSPNYILALTRVMLHYALLYHCAKSNSATSLLYISASIALLYVEICLGGQS
jgi:hypothetical protein